MNLPEIPIDIANEEELVRILLNPIHINKENEIKPYAFQPPPDSQDISVNRRDYTTFEICKKQGLAMQNNNNRFFGLGLILVEKIRLLGFEVKYTPTEKNVAHSDILIGVLKQKGEPLPTEITIKIKRLIKEISIQK